MPHKGYFVGRDEGDPTRSKTGGGEPVVVSKRESQVSGGEPVVVSKRESKVSGGEPLVVSKRESIGDVESNTNVDNEKITKVIASIHRLYPYYQGNKYKMEKIVVDAYKSTDNIFGVDDAIAWGSGFQWPVEVFTRDVRRAEISGFDLVALTRVQLIEMADDRMSLLLISQLDRGTRSSIKTGK